MAQMAGIWIRARVELTAFEGELYLTSWWEYHHPSGSRFEQKVTAVGFFRPTRMRLSSLHLPSLGQPSRVGFWDSMAGRIEEPLR